MILYIFWFILLCVPLFYYLAQVFMTGSLYLQLFIVVLFGIGKCIILRVDIAIIWKESCFTNALFVCDNEDENMKIALFYLMYTLHFKNNLLLNIFPKAIWEQLQNSSETIIVWGSVIYNRWKWPKKISVHISNYIQ